MHKIDLGLIALLLFALVACKQEVAPQANNHEPSSPPVATSNKLQDGTYCFSKVFNQDVTEIQLTISGNEVTGIMNWIPYEKDSARGTLKGSKNAAGELDLIYDYMIEGSWQTETKVMKIEAEKLLLKVGELLDPKYDGHLIYKDVNQAKYSESLEKVACKTN